MGKRKFSALEEDDDVTSDQTVTVVSKKRKRVKKKRAAPVDDRNGVKEETCFPHSWILYSRNFREKLPHSHVLDQTGNDFLPVVFQSVLDMDCGVSVGSVSVERLLSCQYLVNIFVKMTDLWQKNKKIMRYVVNAHCGKEDHINSCSEFTDRCYVSCDDMTRLTLGRPPEKTIGVPDTQNPDQRKEKIDKVLLCVPWKKVLTLLIHVIHRLVPLDVWGHGSNRSSFLKNMKNLLKLGRHDIMYVGDVMKNICPTQCSWANDFRTFHEKVNIVSKVYLWVLKHIVMTVLYSYFYITETGFKRYQVIYIRKCIWQSTHEHALWTMMKDGRLRKMNSLETRKFNKVIQQCLKNKDFKVARLRFLPKVKGVRPIIASRNGGLTKLEISNAKKVLEEMIKAYSHGSKSVRALPKLHEAWQTFVLQRKAAEDLGPLYFVKVDVKDAYGSILQKKMMSLITEQYLRLGPKVGFSQCGVVGLSGQVGKKRILIPLDANGRPTKALKYGSQPLLEVGEPIWINTVNVFRSLRLVVKGQLVRNGQSQYLVTQGISQGGALSSLLCELYYSAMCSHHLAHFSGRDSILLRSVDDFLYVSPHKDLAESFLQTMKDGIMEYNCSINELKTQTNLNTDGPVQFTFTGSILCSNTCEVMIDVSSLQNIGFRYSMRLNQYRNSGNFFAKKLLQVSVAKMAPLYIDPAYTSLLGAVNNVWRNSLLAAGRFVAMVETFLKFRGPLNIGFLVHTALVTARKMYNHLMRACLHNKVTQPLSKNCVVGCYILALFTMVRKLRISKWFKLLMCLRGVLSIFVDKIPDQERCLLPGRYWLRKS